MEVLLEMSARRHFSHFSQNAHSKVPVKNFYTRILIFKCDVRCRRADKIS
jgi:hypothetical protein